MTIAELKEKLNGYPDDTIVLVRDGDYFFNVRVRTDDLVKNARKPNYRSRGMGDHDTVKAIIIE